MWMRSTYLALFPHHVLASAFKVLCVVDDAQPRILTFLIPSLSLSLSHYQIWLDWVLRLVIFFLKLWTMLHLYVRAKSPPPPPPSSSLKKKKKTKKQRQLYNLVPIFWRRSWTFCVPHASLMTMVCEIWRSCLLGRMENIGRIGKKESRDYCFPSWVLGRGDRKL